MITSFNSFNEITNKIVLFCRYIINNYNKNNNFIVNEKKLSGSNFSLKASNYDPFNLLKV